MAFAVVTGASGGIGWAVARELASRKHDLLLLARSAKTLENNCQELRNNYGVQAHAMALDLSAPDAAVRVKDWITEKNFSVDVLVNNAGFGSWGNLNDLSRIEVNQMMQLNMQTPADLCKLLLPNLLKNKQAFILNVASTAAYQAVPTLTTYAATKAFILLFSRGLRWELKGTPVSVSVLSPGPTSTGFIDRANLGMIKEKAEKFSMTAEAVARIAIRGMYAKQAEIIPGFPNWISAKLAEIVPKFIPEMIARNLYKSVS